MRRDKLRHNALVKIEGTLGFAIKYALLFATLLVAWVTRSELLSQPLTVVYIIIFIVGVMVFTALYKVLLLSQYITPIILSVCLEIFSISLIIYTLTDRNPNPILLLLLILPVLRVIILYPDVLEFALTAATASGVFLLVTATLSPLQMALPFFWICFGIILVIFALGALITSKLMAQLNHSVKNYQLILQALQMVTYLVEMAESTAHLREKNQIFQKSVDIISRVMAVHNCVAWVYQDNKLVPAASARLEAEQMAQFQKMNLSINDIPIFDRALAQKVPVVVTSGNGELEKLVPSSYCQCFEAKAMLVIPMADSEQILGCVALHWNIAPKKIAPQELAILSGIATQVGITVENICLMGELRKKEEMRGRLLERVISVQEEERKHIARELHDQTGQILTALMVNVELLKVEPEFQSDRLQERLEETSNFLSRTMKEIHDLSLDLHPKILEDFGLIPAIRSYAKNRLERLGIEFSVTNNNLDHSLSPKQEICLFRVAQEAITNVIKHSHAHAVGIELGIDTESVFLNIKDDGMGFYANGLSDSRYNGESSLGLRSMEERVHFLNGQMDIRSELGKGTEISVVIPLQTGSDIGAEDKYSSC